MISNINQLILDMDGVLWHGETAMPRLPEFFASLDDMGIRYALATNNAAKTVEQYGEKFSRFGVTMPLGRIVTSAEATASYLASRYEVGTPAYLVGEEGLWHAMRARGFQLVTADEVQAGSSARLVVAGLDKKVTYHDLAMAGLLVHRGATFIGTNPDPSYPTEYGPFPGAGSLLNVITATTGVEPEVIGKPGRAIFDEAVKRLGGRADETAMVGDRLSTDIAGGKAAGLETILVLSGVSTRDDVASKGISPDYIFADIHELADALRQSRSL